MSNPLSRESAQSASASLAPSESSATPFLPIQDSKEIFLFLKEATKTLAPITLWNQESSVENSHFVSFLESEPAFYAWVSEDQEAQFKNLIDSEKKQEQQELKIQLSLPSAILFFKTYLIEVDAMGLKFAVPKIVYKVQRRKDFRFILLKEQVFWLELENLLNPEEKLRKKILDLSAGGLSFWVEESEGPLFSVEQVLSHLVVFLPERRIAIQEAQVRHISSHELEYPKKTGKKVGIQFTSLSQADSQYLASFVFKQARKYFSKLL